MKFNWIAITTSFLLLTSCATPQKSRTAVTLASFVAGAAIGAGTAPKDERTELHAMYWGGILGIAGALISNYYFSEENEREKMSLENGKLKAEMDLLQNANTVLLKEGRGYFKNSTGEEYFQSGKAKWRLYQVDKWTKDGPNRLFHQDRMVELIPLESPTK